MGGANASAETEIIRRVKRSEDQLSDELLEGIPNEVTLVGIAAKLPWRAWQLAASLSPDWQRAFEGGMVYDARVCSQRTETFVVVLCDYSKYYHELPGSCVPMRKRTLSLSSPNEERWYKLPPIPSFPAGMPNNIYCRLACLESSIYVLGGTRSGHDIPSAEVFVLDLAVHPLEWRRCADMQIQRRNFHVGVMHGKIFVFGGDYYPDRMRVGALVSECSNEVYDPKLDAWSWIGTLMPSESAHRVYRVLRVWSVGQQFVCHACVAQNPAPNPAALNPAELRPWVSDDEFYDCGSRLFVRAGARGPSLRFKFRDDRFAEDQMDGLHNIIENQLIDKVRRLPWSRPGKTHADDLAYFVKKYEERRPDSNPFLWTYDPLKDDWREFETESLGTNTVESWDYERTKCEFPLPFDRHARVDTWVWTMSF